jgi:ribosomal protein L11 methyltransferase
MAATGEWVTLRIEVPPEIAEGVANFLLEAGAPGVVTGEDDGACAGPPDAWARLEAPFASPDQARVTVLLRRYLDSLGEIHPRARRARLDTLRLPPIDWSALYRTHHRPLAVGRSLLVAPPWDVPAAPDREVLVIEPGMAFGTGQHPTTRGCLEAIESVVAERRVGSALDVGTGSGVLALALSRLGVARVVALDRDAAVLPVARETLRRNHAESVDLVAGTVSALRSAFDVVVANLLADALAAEAAGLAAAVAPGGRLVVSGLLEEQAATAVRSYPGWLVVERRADAGWETLTLAREAAA